MSLRWKLRIFRIHTLINALSRGINLFVWLDSSHCVKFLFLLFDLLFLLFYLLFSSFPILIQSLTSLRRVLLPISSELAILLLCNPVWLKRVLLFYLLIILRFNLHLMSLNLLILRVKPCENLSIWLSLPSWRIHHTYIIRFVGFGMESTLAHLCMFFEQL